MGSVHKYCIDNKRIFTDCVTRLGKITPDVQEVFSVASQKSGRSWKDPQSAGVEL